MSEVASLVLIADDEEEIRADLDFLIKREGFRTIQAADGDAVLKMVYSEQPDMILLDVKMPGPDGMEVLKRIKKIDKDLPVVILTAFAGIHQSVEAMRSGAHDYLSKPFDIYEVVRVIHRALTERALKKQLNYLSNRIQDQALLVDKMGLSDKIQHLMSEVQIVASSRFSVIILGETGSGKELVAQSIHKLSDRAAGPFVAVDCGAIPEALIESELFGHEKGSFTGADRQKMGKFVFAKGGTIFLDEISNMPLASQAKLLRALQEKTITPVGGIKQIDIDVRVIAASNQDLLGMIDTGTFRRDLFYRLNEFTISIPPLRERKEDIIYLSKRMLDITNIELNKLVRGFSEEAVETLLGYDWPGNVRQLQSVIRRAVLLAEDVITEKHLNIKRASIPGLAYTPKIQGMPWKHLSLKEIVDRGTMSVEREVLSQVLKLTGGNKAKAARMLQIDYKTIHTKIKKFGLLTIGGNYEE